jgi:hypothetical protein
MVKEAKEIGLENKQRKREALSLIIMMMNVAGVASAAKSSGDGGGSCRASCVRCCVLGRVSGFNHKIMIKV